MHVAWSGNCSFRVERSPDLGATIGGGELLQPGEVVLEQGDDYTTPWVVFGASEEGLDGLAAAFHTYERSWPAHPTHQPVVLNVWEAVWFDHDLPRLREIADRAARVGIERFVLDDGWFHGRRDDTAGLGDWWVDHDVWPEGLTPIAEHVRSLGMQFGLWFEPEMVNPDSELYRAHPDWILATGARVPQLHRSQLVLDLSRPEVWQHVHDHVHQVLSSAPVDYVKWDHNRELLDAGSAVRGGASAVRDQTHAFYRMLDSLRELHPDIDWESCASGGGRIDLGVLERTQRVWTSDMTDALARQHIQRWTAQLVAPEYLGAHVSSPVAHQTGRTLPLDFRAGHRDVRRVRRRVGPQHGLGRRARRAGRVGRRCTSSSAPCCTRAGWSVRSPRTRPCCSTASCRPTATRPCWRTSSSTSRRATAARWCGFPASPPRRRTPSAGSGPSTARRRAAPSSCPQGGPTEGVEVLGAVLGDARLLDPAPASGDGHARARRAGRLTG